MASPTSTCSKAKGFKSSRSELRWLPDGKQFWGLMDADNKIKLKLNADWIGVDGRNLMDHRQFRGDAKVRTLDGTVIKTKKTQRQGPSKVTDITVGVNGAKGYKEAYVLTTVANDNGEIIRQEMPQSGQPYRPRRKRGRLRAFPLAKSWRPTASRPMNPPISGTFSSMTAKAYLH